MNKYEREVGVTVIVGRLGIDCEDQSAAGLGGRLGNGSTMKGEKDDETKAALRQTARIPAGFLIGARMRRCVIETSIE
jgi:hypothetical protein